MNKLSNIAAGPSAVDGRTVNLNRASEEVLARLPMIGPRRAKALVQYRPHRNWDEVEQIPGFDRVRRLQLAVGRPLSWILSEDRGAIR